MSEPTIKNDTVVAMHYVLRDPEGTVIDESTGGEPLFYLHGHENIVPGLEAALTGARVGDKKDVVVAPEDGYGEVDDEMVLRVPRSELPEDLEPSEGMELAMETPDGHQIPVRVVGVEGDLVILDANHELAGVTLHFSVSIESVRAATAEELAHGHVHGPGAHHHH